MTRTLESPRARSRPEPSEDDEGPKPLYHPVIIGIGVGLVVAAGVALRFYATSPLWLDEALSVNIAKVPLDQLPERLRHDGAPPLYYALLHLWMSVFGSTDVAVRALSGLFGVAALPLMWLAGTRLAGREAGWMAVAVTASSPFAIRYATETRMYSLVVLLTVVGFLLLDGFLKRPTTPRLAGLMAVAAMLVLTHYWALFLMPVVLFALAVHADRSERRMPSSWALVGLAVGCGALLGWLPSLLYQVAHTGTPWSRPAGLSAILAAVFSFSGGDDQIAPVLGLAMLGLAALGVLGRAVDHRQVVLDLRGEGPGRGIAFVVAATLVGGVVAGFVTGSGFAPRYASVVLAPFLLLVVLGIQAVGSARTRWSIVGVLSVLGLAVAIPTAAQPRTQAVEVADVILRDAQPNDLVVFCPDQLGPATHRYIGPGLRQVTFPKLADPRWVDWVDYSEAHRQTDAGRFARLVHRMAGNNDIWLVWAFGYRGTGGQCDRLKAHLTNIRPENREFVPIKPDLGPEHQALYRYSAQVPQPTTGPQSP